VEDKKLIAERLNEFLEPIRARRQELLQDRDALLDVLHEGSRKAKERAAETMDKVRSVMSINYGDLR
jgi:tryptophanyl-tRNA synthetase